MLMDDRFANVLAAEVTESAANTITFAELVTGISIAQGLGLIIDQVFWFPAAATLRQLDANTDQFTLAITSSDQVTDPADYSDRRVIAARSWTGDAVGTAATQLVYHRPQIDTYEPPVILASPRLFLCILGAGLASAGSGQVRIHFRFVKLSTQEYLEIAETFLLTG